jgi:hypothetical protein
VRLNGRVYEAVAARLGHRPTCDLFHSALVVHVPEGRFVIEQAPVRDANGAERGVVAEGAVGARWAGRSRVFRYEVRRWRDGVIPDVAEAVGRPQRLTGDPHQAQRLFDLVPSVPTPVWGRDEFGVGEMWNSNSIISWLIARSGMAAEAIPLPTGGRAPGLGGWYCDCASPCTRMTRDEAFHTEDDKLIGSQASVRSARRPALNQSRPQARPRHSESPRCTRRLSGRR